MIYILLISSVIIGCVFGYYFGEGKNTSNRLLVLSAGFLLSVTVLEIFPEVYTPNHQHIGIWILAGVILQLILEGITKGFEHGHFHHEEEKNIFPVALTAGMFIHAFFEGIPLSSHSNLNSPYLLGILIHNLPISFVMGIFLLRKKHFSRPVSWAVIILFALASPLGMIFGDYFNNEYQAYMLALVCGIFLHISSVIIFESNQAHKMDLEKIILILIGMAAAYAGHLFHEH